MRVNLYICQHCWLNFERLDDQPAEGCPRCGSDAVVLQASETDSGFFGCDYRCANASKVRCSTCPNRQN